MMEKKLVQVHVFLYAMW